MENLNKLLACIQKDSEIFKKPDINFIIGLTTTQIKDLKKTAIYNKFIKEEEKKKFFLTDKGMAYLQEHPFSPEEINLEYLKQEKTPPTVTKAIRNLAKHLLSKENLKENSTEEHIYRELIYSNKCKKQKAKMEKLLLQDDKFCLKNIREDFPDITNSVFAILLLNTLSKNIDKLAVYEKGQFTLDINYLVFDRMICCPQNFELQKTITDRNSLLEDISEILLPEKSNNILDITKGLYRFIKELDKYVINTERLTKKTLRFKNIIMNAKDPISLFYRDIPKILTNKQLKECDKTLVNSFKETIEELKNAKANLSEELLSFTLEAFQSDTRTKLSQRFNEAKEYIGEKELKILSNNILCNDVDNILWIDRIATFVNKSRVPKDWSDEDVADFKVKIKELALKFITVESCVSDFEIPMTESLNKFLKQILKLSKAEKNILLRHIVNS